MALRDLYQRQVALLVRILPFVAQEKAFALKGGTAINLFVRDFPRLSVDIDLTYLPVQDRPASLADIDAAMLRIKTRIEDAIARVRVMPSRLSGDGVVTKLVARVDDVQIIIEVTPVLRGTVYDPVILSVAPQVEDHFGFAEMQVVSPADLYAGKIVAALDRQHPRDLFDVRELLASEGISDELRRAFIVYVISHPRPIAELLSPTRKPLEDEYQRGFVGMTDQPVSLDDLVAAREAMIAELVNAMPDPHRHFLIGFKRGAPDWALLGLPEAQNLPAVLWKQHNLDLLPAEKRRALADALESLLLG